MPSPGEGLCAETRAGYAAVTRLMMRIARASAAPLSSAADAQATRRSPLWPGGGASRAGAPLRPHRTPKLLEMARRRRRQRNESLEGSGLMVR
jgi:hypothetical protein